jgi:hypothetical protein
MATGSRRSPVPLLKGPAAEARVRHLSPHSANARASVEKVFSPPMQREPARANDTSQHTVSGLTGDVVLTTTVRQSTNSRQTAGYHLDESAACCDVEPQYW